MKRYESTLDTKSAEFKQRRNRMLDLLNELNLRRKKL